MTINLLFFTVTFKVNKMTAEEAIQNEKIRKNYEENTVKINNYRYFM